MSWYVLRLWHIEVLSSVADNANANTFDRTSYCLAPQRWREFPVPELQRRVEFLLEASYRRRNHSTASSGDPAEMWWIGYAFEWVASTAMPALSRETMPAEVWLRTNMPIHAHLLDGALDALEAHWLEPRPGLDARPWTQRFAGFSIDADGETWKLLRYGDADVDALFDAHIRGA